MSFSCHFLSFTKLPSISSNSAALKLTIAFELIPPFHPLTVSPQLSRPSAEPGSALETFVGEDVNSMLIVNLLSGTEYSVKVMASYSTGSSEALAGRAKTCKSILSGGLSVTTFVHCFEQKSLTFSTKHTLV